MKKFVPLMILSVILIFLCSYNDHLRKELHEVETKLKYEQESNVLLKRNTAVRKEDYQSVRFTSYWEGDSTGSGSGTASGLNTDDFQTNELGWYTYNGKVVVGAATEECLNSNKGACDKYKTLPYGYISHKLWDEIVLEIDGKDYPAIILDHCGACMRINGEESLQRYDVFVSSKQKMIDKEGKVR